MSKDNTPMILGGLVLAYFYIQRRQAAAVGITYDKRTGVASMPSSVGSGSRQVATGALVGLLQGLAAGPRNNTSQSVFNGNATNTPYDDWRQSGTVQDVVNEPADLSDMLEGNTDTMWWA